MSGLLNAMRLANAALKIKNKIDETKIKKEAEYNEAKDEIDKAMADLSGKAKSKPNEEAAKEAEQKAAKEAEQKAEVLRSDTYEHYLKSRVIDPPVSIDEFNRIKKEADVKEKADIKKEASDKEAAGKEKADVKEKASDKEADVKEEVDIKEKADKEAAGKEKAEQKADVKEEVDIKDITDKSEETDNFWNRVKKFGLSNAYPTLKAIADSLAKNAQMSADRANILTGGKSDPSVYSTIETEYDKINEKQLAEIAKYGISYQEATRRAQEEGDFTYLQRMVVDGYVDYDTASKALNMTKEELEKRFEQINRSNEAETTTKEAEATKAVVSIKSLTIEQKTTLQNNINTLRTQASLLRTQAANLRKDDSSFDTYSKAMAAFVGTAKGLKQSGSVDNVQDVINKTFNWEFAQDVAPGTFPQLYVQGNTHFAFDGSSDKSSTNGSTTTLSDDVLALSEYKDAKEYAAAGRKRTLEANKELADKLDYMASQIEKNINEWEKELKEFDKTTTKLNYSYAKGAKEK